MSDNKGNEYNTIIKRISAFGGVQILNIIVNLVRGKFIALFLGPDGMGLSSLFTSSTNVVQQMGSLGLNLSLVKEIASSKDDPKKISSALAVILKLIIFTALLGGLICLFLSPLLSLWSFGSYNFTLSFIFLGIYVAFAIAANGYLAILQGMSEIKRLSKASLVGSCTGLLVGIPLYYFFGYDGIVPAMIILSLAVFMFYYINYKRSVKINKEPFVWSKHKPLAKRIVTLGLILMIGNLVGTATNYLINTFIRIFGDIGNVGLFQAGNSLTNQYVGIVFSAMAMDYFPRLSAACHDKEELLTVVNRQSEIVMLIATPLVLALIWSAPWVISLLLTDEFLKIVTLVRWLGLGILFQAISFPLGYIFIAKENRKVYIWLEVIGTNILWLLCSSFFYYFMGLDGLGVSLVVRGAIDILLVFFICKKTYEFKYTESSLRIIVTCIILGIGGFFLSQTYHLKWNWPIIPVLAASILLSFTLLKRRFSLKEQQNQ